MRLLHVRIRTMMILVAAAALSLSVELTTTWMDPTSRAILLITCCMIAAGSVVLSEFAPDAAEKAPVPPPSLADDPVLTLMRLSRGGPQRRSRGGGRSSPSPPQPALVSAGRSWLKTWSLRFWALAACFWFFATALANAFELRRMEETTEEIRALRVVGMALLCAPALALTLVLAGRLAVLIREHETGGHAPRE